MGRYYEGDIEGKFWFGCQSSYDGELFGATPQEPHVVEYAIELEDIHKVLEGIHTCKQQLGKYVTLFNKAYEGGIKEDLEFSKLSEDKQNSLYELFASLDMGMRILIYFNEHPNDPCYFTAEL